MEPCSEKEVLTKSGLKLRLKFPQKVRQKLPKDIWTGGVGFYLGGASFTHNMNPLSSQSSKCYVVHKTWTRLRFWFHCKGNP